MQYCSLQHQTLLLSPVTSTTGYCFCFGSTPSFFLELFFCWSLVAYWAPTDLGRASFSILSFCLFILFMGFSKQEYWSGLPFPSPVDHILWDLSTMTRPSWMAPPAWLSFIELDKAVVLLWLDWLSFLWVWFQYVCPLMPSCNTYHLTWVSLTLDMRYLFMVAPAKDSWCSLPWMRSPLIPTRFFRINTQKRCPFHYRELEDKSRKSRNTWSNRQIWPWNTEWSRAKANRVLPREHTGHSKHPLPTT